MKAFRTTAYLLLTAFLLLSCIEDKSKYEYRKTNEVTYLSVLEGFTSTFGEEREYVAPIEFSEPFKNEADIDRMFDIQWFIGEEKVAEGYRIKYTFNKVGGFALYLKVVNRETGETYVSDGYTMESKSSISVGWMILTEKEGGESSLSFISPSTLLPTYKLEEIMETGSIGAGPKNLYYYYVNGAIPNNYVSGLPKVVVNQSSGTVTLDGSTLMQDKWMRDEFSGGTEPESDFTMTGFGWKDSYYLIHTAEKNVYLRCMNYADASIPYFGFYSSMPYTFEGGAEITYFQGFQNLSYWVADEDCVLMYDGLNHRFIGFVKGGYGSTYESYSPKPVYFSNYDENFVFEAGVPKVNELPSGTKCIAAGAYEKIYVDPEYGGLDFYPSYVALLDLGGAGNMQLYQFTVNPISDDNHIITENSMIAFAGAEHLTDKSIVQMSSNLEKHPYIYFTDGGRGLYVYSMKDASCRLAYTAAADIVDLCTSPIVSEFSAYGGNSEKYNFRMAVAQADGGIGLIDVSNASLVRLFENFSPDLEIKKLSGFGSIIDMVWATNYNGEY